MLIAIYLVAFTSPFSLPGLEREEVKRNCIWRSVLSLNIESVTAILTHIKGLKLKIYIYITFIVP